MHGRLRLSAAYFLFGFAISLVSGTLLREVLVTFHGVELNVGGYYGSWFLWIAVGALASRLGRPNHAGRFSWCMAALPVAFLASLALLRSWKALVGLGGGTLLSLESRVLGTAVGVAPSAFLVGYVFPSAASLFRGGEDPVSWAYFVEAAGSVLGGAAFSFLFATRLGVPEAMAAVGTASAIAVALVAVRRLALAAAVGWGVLWAGGAAGPWQGLDGRLEQVRWEHLQRGYELLARRYTPYSHLAVARAEGSAHEYGLFVDGRLAEAFPDRRRNGLRAAHVLAQAPGARRILLLGGGLAGLVPALLGLEDLERLDLVLLDPGQVSLLRRYLPPEARRALSDPRFHLHATDPRRFVTSGAVRDFDLVVLATGLPSTLAANRVFTVEFFRQVRSLSPGAKLLVFFSRDEPAYLTPTERYALASVYASLQRVFPRVAVLTGDVHYFVAAASQATQSSLGLARAYRRAKVSPRPYPVDAFPGPGFKEKLSQRLTATLAAARGMANRDSLPVTFLFRMAYLGQITHSRLAGFLLVVTRTGGKAAWLCLLALVGFLLVRRVADPTGDERRRSAVWALGIVGMASMSFQVLLMVAFQARLGSLYRELGLLAAASMAGLALGALAGRRLRATELALPLLVGLVGLLAAGLPWLVSVVAPAGLAGFSGLALGCSFLTGAVFPAVSRFVDPAGEHPADVGASLETSDHVGAALGGLVFGVFLLPALGLERASLLVALLLVVAALLVGLESLPVEKLIAGRCRRSFPWGAWSWRLGLLVLLSMALGVTTRSAESVERRASLLSATGLEQEMVAYSRQGYRVEERREPFPHLRLHRDHRLDAVVFSTRHTAPNVRGYAGPIELLVTLGADGTLRRVELGRHQETPSYVNKVPEWLEGLAGLGPEQPLSKVDTLTGATVTTKAILRILDRSRQRAMAELLGAAEARGSAQGPRRHVTWAAVLAVLLLLAALASYLFLGHWTRLAILVASFGLYGLAWNIPLTALDLTLLVTSGLPSALSKVAVVGGALLLAVLFGQVWCGMLCPFGAAQELLWLGVHPRGLRAEAGLGQSRWVHPRLEQAARYAKYPLAALAASSFFLTGRQAFLLFDPMTWAFRGSWSLAEGLLVGLVAVGSLALYRPWCRYTCPVGALLSLGNKLSLLDRFRFRRKISACDLGVRSARDVGCIRCNRCLRS